MPNLPIYYSIHSSYLSMSVRGRFYGSFMWYCSPLVIRRSLERVSVVVLIQSFKAVILAPYQVRGKFQLGIQYKNRLNLFLFLSIVLDSKSAKKPFGMTRGGLGIGLSLDFARELLFLVGELLIYAIPTNHGLYTKI